MKLIKKKEDWYNLYDGEIGIGSTHEELQGFKLSLKNCQAIERGYDLDELAEEWVFDKNSHKWSNNDNTAGDNYGSFKAGFKTALELMGDKKFSVDYLKKMCSISFNFHKRNDLSDSELEEEWENWLKNNIQSQQPTEWDVEVVTENVCGRCYSNNTNECWSAKECSDGKYDYSKPLLDADGCLILKRI